MSDNTSHVSVSNTSLSRPLMDWTVPVFTPAAQARVTDTMALFLFAALFIFRTVKAESVDFTQCVTHGSFLERWHETAYDMFHFVTLYVIPLLVMSCCYTCILILTGAQVHVSHTPLGRVSETQQHRHDPEGLDEDAEDDIIIILSFVVCWTPYYLLGIWYWFQPKMLKLTPEYIHHLLFVFGNLNTCCDPVIYGLYTPSFRSDLARFCHCRSPAESPRSLTRLSTPH